MNCLRRFIIAFATFYVVVQDPTEGASLFRRQDVSPDDYMDDEYTDFEARPAFPSDEIAYAMKPDVPRVKEIRNKLTPDEILRQARRERNRVLLGHPTTRKPLTESPEGDSGIIPTAGTRYGATYVKKDTTKGEDTGNPKLRPHYSPELDYDDGVDGAGASRTKSFDTFEYNRLETKTPEPVRGSFKTPESRYKLGNEKSQSNPNGGVESYDLKTLSTIIKNLRSEKLDQDKTSNNIVEGRRLASFTKERAEAKVRTNSGGLQRTEIKPQVNLNLGDYLISRPNGLKSQNVEQASVRQETGVAAKEHVLKLLEELEKLEEIKELQRALDSEDDNAQYYELKQELADDVRIIRNKVRQAIRELQ